jgi:tetraacyldisaccharide 4'-kinase
MGLIEKLWKIYLLGSDKNWNRYLFLHKRDGMIDYQGGSERIKGLRNTFTNYVFTSPSNGGLRHFLLSPLALASTLYRQLAILRYQYYQRGLFSSRKLPIPVISVGNLTVGGTGKTPATLYLARLFQSQGKRVVVLSRGYKGSASQKVNIVSDGEQILLSPNEAGDEPFLLAEKLPGIPVLTGKDRGLLGEYAQRELAAEVVILDDGFQHLKLQRDLDIVLVDGKNPLGNGFLLPRGTLREPPEQLARAHLFLVTQLDTKKDGEAVERLIRLHNRSAPVFFAQYAPVTLEGVQKGEMLPLEYLRGKEVVALAGVARPESFLQLLIQLGAHVVRTLLYPDHHRYQPQDLNKSEKDLVIVTTEKDAVKLRPLSLPDREILALGIELTIDKETEFQRHVRNYLP